MQKSLQFAALAEAATGLALLAFPSLVVELLLGQQPAGVAIPLARVIGIALIGLGIACWPGPPRLGMSVYGGLVMLYLTYLGITGNFSGILLWPAVVAHAILTVSLLRAARKDG